MSRNSKKPSTEIVEQASRILRDDNASAIAKRLAGSVVAQAGNKKQTGAEMEDIASKVLRSDKYNAGTKALAGSVLSQSNKER